MIHLHNAEISFLNLATSVDDASDAVKDCSDSLRLLRDGCSICVPVEMDMSALRQAIADEPPNTLTIGRRVQFRFPHRRGRRIRKKWEKRPENWRGIMAEFHVDQWEEKQHQESGTVDTEISMHFTGKESLINTEDIIDTLVVLQPEKSREEIAKTVHRELTKKVLPTSEALRKMDWFGLSTKIQQEI